MMPSAIAAETLTACRVRIGGHVQGVGFRPFVKRLADDLGLAGGVGNDSAGVVLDIEGLREQIEAFLANLQFNAPVASRIEALNIEAIEVEHRHNFEIYPCPEEPPGPCHARVPRDSAMCAACLAESCDPADRRFRYAFTTCTTCGPRYTLLNRMPYERDSTSMRAFPFCRDCACEFANVDDRRFHAEVMACPQCGPRVFCGGLKDDAAMVCAAESLRRGEIVALKGLGGYQLLTRADNDAAIARLRARKHRPTKPLAVMVRTIAEADRYADLSTMERELLASRENAIVLVKSRGESGLGAGLAPHLDYVGLMLPTTPMHYRLLERFDFPVVATSCNRGEEPILADEAAPADLAALADVVLTHDRHIVRRLDDSVVRVVAGQPSVIRLARGYAPLPLISLESWLDRLGSSRPAGGVLALGSHQKNAVALWTGTQAILGPHLGDLDSARTRSAWQRHLGELSELYGSPVRTLAVDLHPDYAARRWAEASGLPIIEVAHHHAHATAAMVEHDLLDETVLALTWDGTGLGPTGGLWGGECLRASIRGFERFAALRPIRLPGGDAAIRQPWRIAVGMLIDAFSETPSTMWTGVSNDMVGVVAQMLDRRVCCPTTTSMGRLFDGIASLILGMSVVSHEGEAAAWLESTADSANTDGYPIIVEHQHGTAIWDWRPAVRALIADCNQGVSKGVRAARFHNTIARWAQIVTSENSEVDVVLTGGCFQNALLTVRVKNELEAIGKRVHLPGIIPVNDGGLAAGQLAIALARLA